jgi:DedD protein
MNEGFRQRLVGAVVLTCLALIAWPIVFSDVSNPVVDRRSQIPPMPVFEKYSIEQPTRPKDIDPVPDAEIEPVSDAELADIEPNESAVSGNVVDEPKAALASSTENDEAAVSVVDEKPGLDDRGIPASWVLQVASFSQEKNANELKLKLQQQGYKAYTRKVTTTDGFATRVFIGPRLTKQALLDDKPAIDSMFNVNSLVVSFKP